MKRYPPDLAGRGAAIFMFRPIGDDIESPYSFSLSDGTFSSDSHSGFAYIVCIGIRIDFTWYHCIVYIVRS